MSRTTDSEVILCTSKPSLYADDEQWLLSDHEKPSQRVLVLPVLLSVLVHATLVFWLLPMRDSSQPKPKLTKPIHIQLHYFAETQSENLADAKSTSDVEPDPKSDSPPMPEPLPVSVITKPVLPDTPESALQTNMAATEQASSATATVIEPETLREIISQPNKYRANYLSSEASLTDPTNLSNAVGTTHSDVVFDPRLRARLQSRLHSRLQQQRVPINTTQSELKVVKNIYGETQVELGNGTCLLSKDDLSASGAKNWYMTLCVGSKTEGEQMLERVNNSIKSRR